MGEFYPHPFMEEEEHHPTEKQQHNSELQYSKELCGDIRSFLSHCVCKDPEARWTASELLQHPLLRTYRDVQPLDGTNNNTKQEELLLNFHIASIAFSEESTTSGPVLQ
eukprot:TRINITY_DN48714_c0_g1_i1.p2 TRINITY_DN48714_c0_g1~~TRINITY_DN48714_c0_g1_i1.p2  ORF type:complete len:122 (-),score=18.08 TRINITY_DN48714_c0_g1_i1:19-345(-)